MIIRSSIIAVSVFVFAALGFASPENTGGTPTERQIEILSEVQQLLRPRPALIITSDEEMEKLEKDHNMQVRAFEQRFEDSSKRFQHHEGVHINVCYDFFFGGDKREYFPTSPQSIRTYKVLHDVAKKYGVGFGASVLSPLDLGPAYYREKGRGGRSYQFQEGLIEPDGSFEIPMRVHRQWFHNKGPVKLYVKDVRAFAFSEKKIGDTAYYAVDLAAILDVSRNARLDVNEEDMKKEARGYSYAQGSVLGNAGNIENRNRVMAVIVYDVEEMDYFHEDALPYITGMLDAHKAAGISYDSFYSDEMHIQFDWDLRNHFGTTEINTRYITPGLIDAYAKWHGEQYRDFEKFLIYFAFAQHGFMNGEGEPEMAQHVFGESPSDIYATWKFRRDYFRLLTDHVVDLFIEGKRYGEKIFDKKRIWTRAHATWQESPPCDHVNAAWKPEGAPISRYDYTPAYDWSSSIRENISACYDYFRWGDFLTGMGNDLAEGGYLDRNYLGAALAASFGVFNEVPYSYWGHWGAPALVSQRVHDVAAAYGLAGQMWNCGYVQNWQHRKTPVLALYSLDLNYVQERFGSWMVQYGYCDYLTEEKFADMAEVLPNGSFRIKDREYTTLLILFEPMILKQTMNKLSEIGDRGGKVLWTGPPAAIYHEDGTDALRDWLKIFGLRGVREAWNGINAEGKTIKFQNALSSVPEFRVPTHLLVDLVYPASPARGTEVVGTCPVDNTTTAIATLRQTAEGGKLVYYGGRPRDDQSGSTRDAPRTLFHLLHAIGCYADSGSGWAEFVSNTGQLLVCESPNGAVSIARHYYGVEEKWMGGFFRPEGETFNESVLPTSHLVIRNARIGPYRVGYDGQRVVTFRMDGGNLISFSGAWTKGITVDGREFRLTDEDSNVTFATLPQGILSEGIERAWIVYVHHCGGRTGDFVLRLPFSLPDGVQWATDPLCHGRGIPSHADYTRVSEGETELRIPPDKQGKRLYLFVEE